MDKLVERWVAIPQQQRYAAVVGIVVLIVGGYWYLFHSSATETLAKLNRDKLELVQKRAQQRDYVDRLPQYEAKYNQLQQDLNEARSQLPDEADVPQLLAQLDNNARQSGLSIVRFEPRPEEAKDFYAEISVELSVDGSFHEIGTFVDAVGKMDRIVNVQNIRMTKPRTVNSKVLVSSDFAIKTYRFIEESQRAPAKKKKK